jgi:hypothetical protein
MEYYQVGKYRKKVPSALEVLHNRDFLCARGKISWYVTNCTSRNNARSRLMDCLCQCCTQGGGCLADIRIVRMDAVGGVHKHADRLVVLFYRMFTWNFVRRATWAWLLMTSRTVTYNLGCVSVSKKAFQIWSQMFCRVLVVCWVQLSALVAHALWKKQIRVRIITYMEWL